MKWSLVVYFLVQGSWYPGDIIAPDGWSKIDFDTEQECLTRMEFLNARFMESDLKGLAKGKCEYSNKYKRIKNNVGNDRKDGG